MKYSKGNEKHDWNAWHEMKVLRDRNTWHEMKVLRDRNTWHEM